MKDYYTTAIKGDAERKKITAAISNKILANTATTATDKISFIPSTAASNVSFTFKLYINPITSIVITSIIDKWIFDHVPNSPTEVPNKFANIG